MPSACTIDWSALANWVQASFTLAAIIVAIRMPKKERAELRKQEFETQRAALVAIARRGKTTIEYLQKRARNRTVPVAEVGWLREEAEAMSAIADRVDLTVLRESALVDAFVKVQEACRTSSRRFKQNINAARDEDGKVSRPVTLPADRFDPPHAAVVKAIAELEQASRSRD